MSFSDIWERLIEEGVIDGVRGRLMSGKEASVFVVERQGELLAAKVYKAREQRTFKATASYTEGRNQTRNSRDKRAMGKRSSYGKTLIEESWRDIEVQALSSAFYAGVRVPKPILLYEDVLLMELLVDEEGTPAPRLADCDLKRELAEPLHREIYNQVRLLLLTGKIHGDLSAFNILMAHGGPTLIDMPQVVDAAVNNQARMILRRDLSNVTEHLARFDARLLRFRDCGEAMWRHYQNGTLESATTPEESVIAKEQHRGRRSRDAEQGRMGRDRSDNNAPQGQGFHRGGHPDDRRRGGQVVMTGSGTAARPEQQQRPRFEPQRPRFEPQRPRSEPPQQHGRSEAPQRPRSEPPPQHGRSEVPQRPRSDPPPQHGRSEAPQRPHSQPPQHGRSEAPQRPRSEPPQRPRSEPPQPRPDFRRPPR